MQRTDLTVLPPVIAELAIENMGLSVRAYNCLHYRGYNKIGEIAAMSRERIARIRNMGTKTIKEITQKLHAYGVYDTAWDTF